MFVIRSKPLSSLIIRNLSNMNSQSNSPEQVTKKLFLKTADVLAKSGLSKSTKEKCEEVCEKTEKNTKEIMDKAGKKTKELMGKTTDFIQKSGSLQQLLIGSFTGFTTGFLATRVGKTTALSVGGSILLVTFASQTGYIKINWDKINSTANKASNKASETIEKGGKTEEITSLKELAKNNMYLTAGLLGGFLVGISC